MPPERPFLTARWTDLLLLNFEVPPAAIARLAPPGTEPDLFDGRAYVSVVGFLFRDTRILGVRAVGHQRFEEVNLRYYVLRQEGNELRRGVVFEREMVDRPAVTAMARWIYGEQYVTRRMRSAVRNDGATLAPNDTLAYEWQTGRRGRRRWNRMGGRAATPLEPAAPGSLPEFLIEHYWGYTHGRDGETREYRVAHRPWRVAAVVDVVWDCDLAATYGGSPLAEYLASPPELAFVADGSAVQVFRGRAIDVRGRKLVGTSPLPQYA